MLYEVITLEIGCGTGNYLASFSDRNPGSRWGIDPSWRMLLGARQQDIGGRLAQAMGQSLPFRNESFELIYSVDRNNFV